MIRIRCRCGEVFHADEAHVGRTLHCRCGRSLPVKLPPPRREEPAAAAPSPRSLLRPRVAASPALVRWLALAAWGYLAAALLIWAALWFLAERWWPATVYLFGPRWVVLLPLVLLVPAAALLRPKLLLPLAAAALVILFPVMGLRSGWRSLLAGETPAGGLRVVSLNLAAQPSAATGLVYLLDELDPDLVALQECNRQVEESFGPLPGWRRHRAGKLCLLSRVPVRDAESLDLAGFDLVREAGVGGTSAAVRYHLEVDGRPVRLVNVHLETPRKGLRGVFHSRFERIGSNAISREIESRRVARWAAEGGGPLLVAGDFNLPVESPIYRESWGGLTNAFSRAGRGFGHTRYNGWIRVRIDHVLAGPGWRVDRAWVGPDVGSDHRPVVADLTWTGGS